jgi:hypothetical protein
LLPKDTLKDLLSQTLSRADKLLICLAVEAEKPKEVKQIRSLAVGAGLRAAKDWNISNILGQVTALAVRTTTGWELTVLGSEHVARIAGPLMNSPIPRVASALRVHLVSISNANSQNFVEESIVCFETRQYRAAIVLSWVGAVSVLYDWVVANDLAGFNAEATKHTANSKHPWTAAKNADDLARMKEPDFLHLLEKRSTLGKSVKQQLQKCLELRNGCGHPNTLQVAEHMVSSHIETLMLNVFSRF